jgi:spore germination protein PF
MPSIVGPIKINSVSGGVVNFGDALNNSPKSTSKSVSGSGGGNTGDFIIVNNGISISNSVDPDVKDQNQTANL